jgi:hypothetical protein
MCIEIYSHDCGAGRTRRLSNRGDAGQDEIDTGDELLAVVVDGQLGCHLMHKGVLGGVMPRRPLRSDGRERAPFGLIDLLTGGLHGVSGTTL